MNGWLIAAAGFMVGSLAGPVVFVAMWRAYRRERSHARKQARMPEAALKAALGRLARAREELRTCREKQQTAEVTELLASYRGYN